MSIDISFVVCCYQQQDMILMALESIKYQIEHFRNSERIQLIVADDGSTDNTQCYIRKWVNENQQLFDEVDLLLSEINRGTCKNTAKAYRRIKGTHVCSLAGDDMLMNTNIIQKVMRVGENEIVYCPPVRFKNNSLVEDKKQYYTYIWAKNYTAEKITQMIKHSCPIINGSLLGKNFYINEEILSFSENYRLLDDRTRFVKAFEVIKDFSYEFSSEPVLLYRLSEKQVTKRSNKLHAFIIEDIDKLAKYTLSCTKNPILRLNIRAEQLKKVHPIFYKARILWDISMWKRALLRIMHKRVFDEFSKEIISYGLAHKVNEYIEEINERANMLMRES